MGKEKISLVVTALVAISTLVFALYYWLTELQVNWYALFICSIALHYMFKSWASVGFNKWIDFHNIPLLFALCAAVVVKPAVEFLIVRRYR
ncbi:hypothetical protein [Bacillus wiedmannii]|uniref:Uncharacterized protein n=1 Tax=Bacillus wiedmannii TaxID=1890302 RepID=A0A2A8BP67_9BACI|nr:hypothetical protein [Bacillus wiedmannii]PEM56025.1 hypothetical protein CN611_12645 [Bacillus wiedmannii]PGA97210.1 hypothetical protein COL92_14630 [Bacillus wiedmannii]